MHFKMEQHTTISSILYQIRTKPRITKYKAMVPYNRNSFDQRLNSFAHPQPKYAVETHVCSTHRFPNTNIDNTTPCYRQLYQNKHTPTIIRNNHQTQNIVSTFKKETRFNNDLSETSTSQF